MVARGVAEGVIDLLDKLNDAIDEIKRDGRFDRINTRFIPFRLQ